MMWGGIVDSGNGEGEGSTCIIMILLLFPEQIVL